MGLEVRGGRVADVDGSGAVGGVLVRGGSADANGRVGSRYDCDFAVVCGSGCGLEGGTWALRGAYPSTRLPTDGGATWRMRGMFSNSPSEGIPCTSCFERASSLRLPARDMVVQYSLPRTGTTTRSRWQGKAVEGLKIDCRPTDQTRTLDWLPERTRPVYRRRVRYRDLVRPDGEVQAILGKSQTCRGSLGPVSAKVVEHFHCLQPYSAGINYGLRYRTWWCLSLPVYLLHTTIEIQGRKYICMLVLVLLKSFSR